MARELPLESRGFRPSSRATTRTARTRRRAHSFPFLSCFTSSGASCLARWRNMPETTFRRCKKRAGAVVLRPAGRRRAGGAPGPRQDRLATPAPVRGCRAPNRGGATPNRGGLCCVFFAGPSSPLTCRGPTPTGVPHALAPRGLGARRGGSPNLGGPAEEAAEGFADGPGDPGGLGSRRGHTRRSAEQRKSPSDEQAGGESNRAPKAPQIGLFGSAQKGKEATKRGLLYRVRNLNVSS